MPSALTATRRGFSPSVEKFSGAPVDTIGHVFGRLGSGKLNIPANIEAFYWG